MAQTKAELRAQGKRNKARGARFELKVRSHFEDKGWHVTKYRNNIDLQSGEIVPAKQYYIPGRGAGLGTGFPDFVMFKPVHYNDEFIKKIAHYNVQFIEAKLNGLLSQEEKLKCKVLTDMGHKVMIAYFDDQCENNIKVREFIYTEGKEKIPRGH